MIESGCCLRGLGKVAAKGEDAMGNTPQESCELFNLIVRAAPDKPMIDSRMLEGTPEWIASRFRSGSRIDIEKLSKLPMVLTSEFAEEGSSAIAVARYVDKPPMNPSISCPVMCFPSQALLDKGILSSSRWENARTRWTVVEGNPFGCSRTARFLANRKRCQM